MIDTEQPQSPGWWLKILARQLQARRIGRDGATRWSRQEVTSSKVRPGIDLLDDYWRGDPPLREDIHSGWEPSFRQFVRMGRLNVADLLITSRSARLQLRDFKTAATEANTEDQYGGDETARDLAEATDLATVARDTHETMFALADSYVIVTPPDLDRGRDHPIATSETPQQVITAHDEATGETLAALKMFRDDWDGSDLAYLFLPGFVHRAKKPGASSISDSAFRMSRSWDWDGDPQPVPGGVRIPVFRFKNRNGVGEFERHLDTLDRINDKIFNEWWIGKIQAFRQRAVKNLPDVDEEGFEIDYTGMFTSSPDAMWQVPDGVEFWESATVDLGPVVNSIQKDLERLAAVSSTPLHMITPDAAEGSAEGASTMKEAHIDLIQDRMDRVKRSWAGVMGAMFAFNGDDDLANPRTIKPLFGPAERHSLTERANAAAQAKDNLPQEAIWLDIWQYPPSEIARLRDQQTRNPVDPLVSLGGVLGEQAAGLPTTAGEAAAPAAIAGPLAVPPPLPPVTG